jgi:hypothetical protein
MMSVSDEESRAIISAFKDFVAFMQILRGYVGEKHESIITKCMFSASCANVRLSKDLGSQEDGQISEYTGQAPGCKREDANSP